MFVAAPNHNPAVVEIIAVYVVSEPLFIASCTQAKDVSPSESTAATESITKYTISLKVNFISFSNGFFKKMASVELPSAETTAKNVDSEVVSAMKQVDSQIGKMDTPIVPVNAGTSGPQHPSVVGGDHKEASIVQKAQYMPLLMPESVGQPIPIEMNITKEDIQTLKKKADIATLRDFDKWVVSTFCADMTVPQTKAWLHEIYPEWFDRQVDAVNDLNDVKKKRELMRIHGPQTIQDIYFMYQYDRALKNNIDSNISLASKGLLGLMDNEDLERIRKLTGNDTQFRQSFERGIFNTRKRNFEMFNTWLTKFMYNGSIMENGQMYATGYNPTEFNDLAGHRSDALRVPQIAGERRWSYSLSNPHNQIEQANVQRDSAASRAIFGNMSEHTVDTTTSGFNWNT